MSTPRKSPTPRVPANGIGNSRFPNYLTNKSPPRISPLARVALKYPTTTSPPESRQAAIEEGLGGEINDLGNEIRGLYNFISTKNTPEGMKNAKSIYGPKDIGVLVEELIHGNIRTPCIFLSYLLELICLYGFMFCLTTSLLY